MMTQGELHGAWPLAAADTSPSVEALIKADAEAALHRLMSALPLELRLPLALSRVDEMTSPEIAAVMGISNRWLGWRSGC